MIRRPPRSTLFPYTNALPIFDAQGRRPAVGGARADRDPEGARDVGAAHPQRLRRAGLRDVDVHLRLRARRAVAPDRKSTRLNSSHANISYAVFCLKKKTTTAS